jgi:hypothetical protein
MSTMGSIRLGLLATVAIAAVSGLPAAAQQITGTPGSPGATTTSNTKRAYRWRKAWSQRGY